MCYGTRVTKAAEQLELHYNVERLYGKIEPDTEFIYNYANGWAHPNMWILPQQRKGKMTPAKWGIMPSTALGEEFKDYFAKNRGAYGGLNLRCEDVFDNYMYSETSIRKDVLYP